MTEKQRIPSALDSKNDKDKLKNHSDTLDKVLEDDKITNIASFLHARGNIQSLNAKKRMALLKERNSNSMISENTDVFWAKKTEIASVYKWLPLTQHLVDAMEVIKLLWEHWLSFRQKKIIIESLDNGNEELAKQLAGFLAAIHDLGKATPAFQTKTSFTHSKDLDIALLNKLEKTGFNGVHQITLMNERKSPHTVAAQALLESYGVSEDISSIIGGHHGKPVDAHTTVKNQLTSYTANYFQSENSNDDVYKKWSQAQKDIFNWALHANGFESVDDLPKIRQPGQVILCGLLIMADWIASNEDYFPLLDIDEDTVVDKEKRKQDGWNRWFKASSWKPQEISDIEESYKKRFGFTPRDVQTKFSEVINETDNGGIYILEAPMGEGKTEAALMGVEQLSNKLGTDGMFFGLPTQATSNGIFDRIKEWISSLSIMDIDHDKRSLQLVHGKAALNDSYSELPRDANIYDESGIIVNSWFTGRKTAILDEFVVGTIDQFLMTALKQKHLMLRHLGFSKKVIVIDEVHAYDAYMNQYLKRAIHWMGAYGVPVIILSATLPAKTRVQLVKEYVRGQGYKWRDVAKPVDWETTVAYPLIIYSDGAQVKQKTEFNPSNNTQVVKVTILDENKMLALLKEKLSDGGVAGVIVNTVKKAQALAQSLEEYFGKEQIELLHSSFIATDRSDKEKKLLDMIGKDAKRPHKKIIIGTQVIEQSLDIDFDLLISDLAPMDLLIQRIGRLHRHKDTVRPEKLSQPTVYVMGVDEDFVFDSGSQAVYGAYLLMRTQKLLPEKINLPHDISVLVQDTYSDNAIELSDNLVKLYEEAKIKHDSEISQKEYKAKGFRLDKPDLRGRKNLDGWLQSQYAEESDQKSVAQVRDIKETVEVIALQAIGTDYGFFDTNEDLSQKIDQIAVQKEIAKHTLRLPLQLSAFYAIDDTIAELETFNKKYLSHWQDVVWLKGDLGIIFDDNHNFILNGFQLHYSSKYGLSFTKEA